MNMSANFGMTNELRGVEKKSGESISTFSASVPTDPVVNDILWVFPPEHPSHQQTIKLYTSESPNHPGKYRIYKSFNRGTKVAYGEFELLP